MTVSALRVSSSLRGKSYPWFLKHNFFFYISTLQDNQPTSVEDSNIVVAGRQAAPQNFCWPVSFPLFFSGENKKNNNLRGQLPHFVGTAHTIKSAISTAVLLKAGHIFFGPSSRVCIHCELKESFFTNAYRKISLSSDLFRVINEIGAISKPVF